MNFQPIIEEVCTKVDRTDLISKIKIVNRRSNLQKYIGIDSVFGQVQYALDLKKKRSTKIVLEPIFQYVSCEKIKEDIIRHELCHVIDQHMENDVSISNGGHGSSFWKLMDKIGCSLGSVNYCFVEHPFKTLSLSQKICFRHKFQPKIVNAEFK
jgi:hypothetical protein